MALLFEWKKLLFEWINRVPTKLIYISIHPLYIRAFTQSMLAWYVSSPEWFWFLALEGGEKEITMLFNNKNKIC